MTQGREADFATVPLSRRRFLIVAGGAAAWLALRPRFAEAARSRGVALERWSLPAIAPTEPVALSRALIGAAVLAPSHWNSQPWRFEVDVERGAPAIHLAADARRALPVTDPDRRWMMMSLGCALENLLVAARAYGLHPAVTYHAASPRDDVVASVTWASGDTRRDRHLFEALTERRTNRREYDGRGLFHENRAKLNAQVSEGQRLHWIDDRALIREIGHEAHDGVREAMRDHHAQAERRRWLRQGDDDARVRGDGVSTDALELGGPAKWFAGRYFDPSSFFFRFGSESAAKQAREQVRSSGALAMLTAEGRGGAEWLKAGQAYERVCLRATQLGISHHPLNLALQHPASRARLGARFGVGEDAALMFVRFGHANPPAPTPRRAAAIVSSYRAS